MLPETQFRVVVADDHPLVVRGIRTALARVEGVVVVAEAGDGNKALQAVVLHKPDLLILDIRMRGLPSDQVVLQAKQLHSGLKTFILSAFDGEAYVRPFRGLSVHGYMRKDEAPESLSQAVRVIRQGDTWFSQSVAKILFSLHPQQPSPDRVVFTSREMELMGLVLAGIDNGGIAERLGLSRQTVSKLLCVIYQKMGVTNRVQSAVWIQENRTRLPGLGAAEQQP